VISIERGVLPGLSYHCQADQLPMVSEGCLVSIKILKSQPNGIGPVTLSELPDNIHPCNV
jgi:hypothetical protein